MFANLQKIKANPETANAGKKWSNIENNKLLDMLKENKTNEEIALELKRTVLSISCQAKNLATTKMLTDNMNIIDASALIKISVEDLEKFIAKKAIKPIKIVKSDKLVLNPLYDLPTVIIIDDDVITEAKIILHHISEAKENDKTTTTIDRTKINPINLDILKNKGYKVINQPDNDLIEISW